MDAQQAPHRGLDNAYGDLKETRMKIDAKYDKSLECGIRTWIKNETGEDFGENFHEGLQSGILLGKLMNKLQPGSVKTSNSKLAFKQMENINMFIRACSPYGMKPEYLFQTPDLYEGTNLTSVQQCLYNLKRLQDMKADGKEVEAQPIPESKALKTNKLGKEVKIPTKKVWKNEGAKKEHYNHEGKEIVNAASGADAENGLYGDMATRKAHDAARRSPQLEERLCKWLGEVAGDDKPESIESLKDGVLLCNALNKLQEGIIKAPYTGNIPLKQRENLSIFMKAAKDKYEILSEQTFTPDDLYEEKNIAQVCTAINAMKLAVEKN